jgi:hypothetical protein
MEEVYLQSVLIRGDMEYLEARKWSQYYIRNYKRTYVFRGKDGWYNFRNSFKNRFLWLKKKYINDRVVLVYGRLKEDGMPNVRCEEGTSSLPLVEGDGGVQREEMSLQGLPTIVHEKIEMV